MRRALVVVLGDLGRSPRMLAHAGSLLRAGYEVHMVGYAHTPLPDTLRRHARLHIHALRDEGAGRGRGMGAAAATVLRGLRLAWRLTGALFRRTPPPDLILVQNPPPLPTLPFAALAASVRGSRLVVDWHNFGWTLLSLRFGPEHILVRATRGAELWFAARADVHLAVSRAMARRLGELGMGEVAVLHDGPSWVRPFPQANPNLPADPLVVVAPMGWTRDDDLPLLAEAIQRLSERLEGNASQIRADGEASAAPRLKLLVSGNGPLRARWAEKLKALGRGRIQVETPDVPAEAYPGLLASSHLGLCIHRSSSRLDIPMKVVEMLAVGIPVLTLADGSPVAEVAPPGSGIALYEDADELARLLQAMLPDVDGPRADPLTRLSTEVRDRRSTPWDEAWRTAMEALPPRRDP